jgi:phosphatidylserine/phosphatidylglycerophosphate/cardiolipin synthase-like enzyme
MRKLIPSLFVVLLASVGCDVGEPLSLPPQAKSPSATTPTQSGPLRVYFTRPVGSPSDPGNPASALAGYIAQAKQTIDVCAFELDNHVVVTALLEAVKRGVKVRLVTETDYLEESGVQALKAAGVPVVDDQRDGALMHNKFMVFDNKSVWTGSMNFTENCAYRNNNHGIYVNDARIAANYATKFQWMFEQRKFGGLPERSARIPNPLVMLHDGTRVENYFSTHDHIADHLVDELNKARSSIQFLAFSFTHTGMSDAMLSRARFGVSVSGVFEKSQATSSYSAYNRLRSAHIQVYTDANPRNMHHKVIIIDNETTVAGSFNFSSSADQSNDENTLVIHSRDLARQFESEFRRLFEEAKAAEGTAVVSRP